jgi:hypothetical protein
VNFPLLDRLARLRRQLAGLGAAPSGNDLPGTLPASGVPSSPRPVAGPIDLLVTHCEVSERHGTGVLLRRLFLGGPPMASVRTLDLYGGEQDFGAPRLKLAHDRSGWTEVVEEVLASLGHLDVRRILCVPYSPGDVQTALAARDVFGAPMCTWVMDDQNIEAEGLSDDLLRRLFARSRLRLAISPEMRRAYQGKFGGTFALAPPAVSPSFLTRVAGQPDPARLAGRRGLVFGNIWGERWLDGLLDTLSGSGVALDWHSGGGTPWMRIDAERVRRAGITVRPHLPERELVETLRASPFVVVPSGTFEGDDSHRFVARLSLPSRLPYLAATAGTPVLILGHPETAAARFVTRHGLGVVVPYQRAAFTAAVETLCRPEAQVRHRAAAAALAPALSAEGMADWIWRSLEAGGPVDGRFDALEQTT